MSSTEETYEDLLARLAISAPVSLRSLIERLRAGEFAESAVVGKYPTGPGCYGEDPISRTKPPRGTAISCLRPAYEAKRSNISDESRERMRENGRKRGQYGKRGRPADLADMAREVYEGRMEQ